MATAYPQTPLGHARGQNLTTLVAYAILAAAAALVLYPFIVLFLGSLKTEPGFITNPLGIPARPTLDNYVYAWRSAHIPQFTVNSVIVSTATVGLTLALASTAAFGLSRFRFRGGRLIYLAFVLLLTIPVQIYIIPLYVVVVRLRLADNFLGLILPYTAGSLPLAVFLFKTSFDGLPGELLDAARMDGCGSLATYWRIVLPLSRPIIATVTVFTFVQAWNEFFLALIFIHNPALQTLPLGLQAFFVNQYQTQFPQLFATLLMSIGPIVVVYLGLQRQFVAGLTAGAVKG